MSSLMIIQLSDVHVKTTDDHIVAKWPALCRAVAAELLGDVKAAVITFCGDAAFGGKTDEFLVTEMLLDQLRQDIRKCRPTLPVHILTVPGNHDCNLTSEDQNARLALRKCVQTDRPSASITRVLLEAQREYFEFAANVGEPDSSLSVDSPFYRFHDVTFDDKCIRFHLLNSSWTSIHKEQDDLRFPVDEFEPPDSPEATVAVTIMHHPVHWFLMPGVRRELCDKIDHHSELVLTGHEHQDESIRRIVQGGGKINYIEGGVLQEHGDHNECRFNIVCVDLEADQQTTKTLTWAVDHFEPKDGTPGSMPIQNPDRIDRRYRLHAAFEKSLNELEDPLTHPRLPQLHLAHIFSYPDLRKIIETGENTEDGLAAVTVERIRSEAVVDELQKQQSVFIIGGDRSGKTSLCKRLYVDLRDRGCLPVLIRGHDIPRAGKDQAFRRTVERAIRSQYQQLTPAEYEQLDNATRIVIVDDFQDGPGSSTARRHVLTSMAVMFEQVILFAGDDLYLELINQGGEDAADILSYQRYEVCDFGYQRMESLAMKWISLGRADPDPVEIRDKALELCQRIQSVLGLAGLPHTPWLLIVILEQMDNTETPFVAARTGNFGHLYHTVITVALSRSQMTQFDLNGKFIYLAEFAYQLHKAARPTLSETEARDFHTAHCERFGLPFDYEKVRDDLIRTRMIRLDEDEIAFRSKWVYCFFVAWWLARNMHLDEAKQVVKDLTGWLYHETSANILVFLAHLSHDPLVISSMRAASAALFRNAPRALISKDVIALNKLDDAGSLFKLPSTPPEINRKLLQEADDDRITKRARASSDGRQIDAVPECEGEARVELHDTLNELRAAVKTISILGQVLRNGATSIEEIDKRAILDELLGLGRRVLGCMYSCSAHIEGIIKHLRHRIFRMMVATHLAEKEVNESESDGDIGLERKELRSYWEDAEKVANRFWFGLNWMATFSLIKRMGTAIGIPLLDGTLNRLRQEEDVLPYELIQLVIRLGRRGKSVPADEMIRLYNRLSKADNRLGKVVLEAVTWERLLLFETDHAQTQKLCKRLGIRMPVRFLDPSEKKFHTRRSRLPAK